MNGQSGQCEYGLGLQPLNERGSDGTMTIEGIQANASPVSALKRLLFMKSVRASARTPSGTEQISGLSLSRQTSKTASVMPLTKPWKRCSIENNQISPSCPQGRIQQAVLLLLENSRLFLYSPTFTEGKVGHDGRKIRHQNKETNRTVRAYP